MTNDIDGVRKFVCFQRFSSGAHLLVYLIGTAWRKGRTRQAYCSCAVALALTHSILLQAHTGGKGINGKYDLESGNWRNHWKASMQMIS